MPDDMSFTILVPRSPLQENGSYNGTCPLGSSRAQMGDMNLNWHIVDTQ